MKRRLLGWLTREGRARSAQGTVGELLIERGVSPDVVLRAAQSRHLLRTRMVSAVVEEEALTETEGLEVLCGHVGLPGIALGRSAVDLRLVGLPAELAVDRLVLPVQREQTGVVLVATADRLPEATIQEVELLLGAAVRPHVTLHFHVRRAVRAIRELRAHCPDAVWLLGDDVAPADVAGAQRPVARVIPDVPLPKRDQSRDATGGGDPCVLVGTAEPTRRRQIERILADVGCRVVTASDGSAFLKLSATEPVDVLIVDALFPHHSGVELIDLLGTSERFRTQPKLLVVPDALPVDRTRLAAVANVDMTDAEEVGARALAAVQACGSQTRLDHGEVRCRARAAYYDALAAIERNETDSARSHLQQALAIDAALGGAYGQLARLRYAAGAGREAETAFRWAGSFDAVEASDLACWAELVQRRGDIRHAVSLWERAAGRAGDDDLAAALLDHAGGLTS